MKTLLFALVLLGQLFSFEIAWANEPAAVEPEEAAEAIEAAPTQCKGIGVEGIQFENTPIDYKVSCNTTILKGTERNRNRAFLMPQPVIAINRNRQQAFDIRQYWDSKGQAFWKLTLGIYFPRNQDDMVVSDEISDYYNNRCSEDEVSAHLNNPANGYRTDIEPEIKLAHVPLRNIRIAIGGVGGYYDVAKGKHIMNSAIEKAKCPFTNNLEYIGHNFLAEFILSERQKKEFIEAVTSRGVQVTAFATFNARVSQSAVYGRIDLSSIAASLEAEFKTGGAVKYIGKVELETKLRMLSEEVALTLTTEGQLNSVGTDIASKITTQLFEVAQKAISESKETTPEDKTQAEGGETGKINVTAVIEGYRKKQSVPVQYNNLGDNQDLIYTTTTIYQDRNLTQNSRRLIVSNLKGEGMKLTNKFMHGQKLIIQVVDKAEQKIAITETRNPMSQSQARALGLFDSFPVLREAVLTNDPLLKAIGTSDLYPDTIMVLKGQTCSYIYWCSDSSDTIWYDVSRKPSFEPQWYGVESTNMENIKLGFSFGLGPVFTAKEIMDHPELFPKFEFYLDSERREIVISAYQDVGAVHVYVKNSPPIGAVPEVNKDTPNAAQPVLVEEVKYTEYNPHSFVQKTYDTAGTLKLNDPILKEIDVPVGIPMKAPETLIAYQLNITGERLEDVMATAKKDPAFEKSLAPAADQPPADAALAEPVPVMESAEEPLTPYNPTLE